MDKVSVRLIVGLTSDTQKDHFYFTDEWNCQIDKFNFRKISEKELEVSFNFQTALSRHGVNGVNVQEIPSEHTRKFQGEEDHLETLLDLISLSTGHGLRIRPDSYLFSCSNFKTVPVTNDLSVEFPPVKDTERRYQKLIKNKYNKSGLIAALRAYRQSLWNNEEPGERVPKLYSALEKMYGQGIGGSLLTKDELKQIGSFLNSMGFSEEKKRPVMERVKSIPAKSINEILVDKINLMNTQGEVTNEEKRRLFSFWRKARSIPAHGDILAKRGTGILDLIFDLESTVEALLYGQVRPQLIHYVVFKEETLNNQFIEHKGKLIGKSKGYSYFAIRNDELKVYLEHIGGQITHRPGSFVYLVSPNNIKKIDETGKGEEVISDSLDVDLKIIVAKIQKKIS